MDQLSPIHSGHYSHDLLLHEGDDELLEGTRAFVEQGLASGGKVLVHGTPERVAMTCGTRLASAAGLRTRPGPLHLAIEHPVRLSANAGGKPRAGGAGGPQEPSLWAMTPRATPPGPGTSLRSTRTLRPYAFHGLCTYDTRTLPAATIAAAKATHPCLSTGGRRTLSPDAQDPPTSSPTPWQPYPTRPTRGPWRWRRSAAPWT